jgi:hypothetical protein
MCFLAGYIDQFMVARQIGILFLQTRIRALREIERAKQTKKTLPFPWKQTWGVSWAAL